MSNISVDFNYVEVNYVIDNESVVRDWVIHVIKSEISFDSCSLSFTIVDDETLYGINVKYLGHSDYTDIITFDLSRDEMNLVADIYISLPRVFENADQLKINKEAELLRVLAHGLLHLCGYGDKTIEEKNIMRRKEEEKMAFFPNETILLNKK